jgi:hypothetical protein
MFAHLGANFAAVRSVACKVYQKWVRFGAGLTLLAISGAVSGCAAPIAMTGQDPANPAVKVAAIGYRSTVAPYASLRPTAPAPWRQQNDSVAPSPKSGQ